MEAIILAGGFGTRLQHIVKDVPKPMAPMDEKGTPFLKIILDYLINGGINSLIFSTGYKSEIIEKYFGNEYLGKPLKYSIETEPLFTGGAIKKALSLCIDNNVLVINGDTFFNVNLINMMKYHQDKNADVTVAVKQMSDFDRYGTVKFGDNGKIKSFEEKKWCDSGFINGGIYIVNRDVFKSMLQDKFSFEKDYLEIETACKNMYAYKSDEYFIDIGIPDDYYKARMVFAHNNIQIKG